MPVMRDSLSLSTPNEDDLTSGKIKARCPVDGGVLYGRSKSGLQGGLCFPFGQAILVVRQECASTGSVVKGLLGVAGLPLHELEGDACPVGDHAVGLQPHHLVIDREGRLSHKIAFLFSARTLMLDEPRRALTQTAG